jgi:dihydroflavonol-4-reductase
VTALCRDPESLADLRHPALRIAAGDLRRPSSFAGLPPPDGSVFHLAAVRNHPRAPFHEMAEINGGATVALAREAGEQGVARFVHLATALIYGPSEQGEIRSERDGFDRAVTAYALSKAVAAERIRGLAREEGLPAVVVCPAIVFGPDHPSHPNRVTSEIWRLLRGGPRIFLAGGRQVRNLVYVEDVVRGLLAAEERGTVGEEYLLGGEEVSPRELAERVLEIAGARGGPAFSVPAGPALGIARLVDRLRGQDHRGGYATAVRNLLREWRFSSEKARRDLGYQPLPLTAGLARTIDWLRSREREGERK